MEDGRLKLGVNIDHVATLRQARYALTPDFANAEPVLVDAARLCEDAGADSITVHLREDRRHIQDRDVYELREALTVPLNLEMGLTPEIREIALDVRPAYVCLVPENRAEITTEGGLDVAARRSEVVPAAGVLRENGTLVSMFIDPDLVQVEAAAEAGARMVELHTGAFANGDVEGCLEELDRLVAAAERAHELGLQVNAGHGITMRNLSRLMEVPHLAELNVGHHLVSRAIVTGLVEAVRVMRGRMDLYPLQ